MHRGIKRTFQRCSSTVRDERDGMLRGQLDDAHDVVGVAGAEHSSGQSLGLVYCTIEATEG